MSMFIVNDKTMNRILSFLFWVNDDLLKNNIRRILSKEEFSVSDEEKSERLGLAIRELNFRSMGERYGLKAMNENRKGFEEFKFIDQPLEDRSIEQVYRHLQCLTYQCCEGVCDQEPLYKMLQELEDSLGHEIANREADKLNCDWEAK